MSRRAFTLVELLVTIAIIAILAGIGLSALYASGESAKAARSQRTVSLLHNAIMDEWEGFRTRRIAIRKGAYYDAATKTEKPLSETDAAFQLRRLGAVWQMMRMELPDRYEDLTFTPTIPESAKRKAYIRRIDAALVALNAQRAAAKPTPQPALTATEHADLMEQTHESSECLYLIITVGLPPETRSTFKARDAADTDGDGMLEVLDGWGRPIHWMRWAPGFESEMQVADPLTHHDQFDPLKLSNSATGKNSPPLESGEPGPPAWGFALVPLIYSAGPDGSYGIYELPQIGTLSTVIENKNNNPFSRYTNGVTYIWRGAPNDSPDETRFDNIHNHALGAR
jgi:prepilin-type N-terminal cleavage/methylation domain-containing protein